MRSNKDRKVENGDGDENWSIDWSIDLLIGLLID